MPETALRWDHLHLRSPDPDAAARWWVDVLGATHKDRTETGETLRVTVMLDGLPLFIDRVGPERGAPPEPPFRGLEHVGLRVDDIAAAVAALEARGAEVVVRPHAPRPGLQIAFLRGPDDVRVELLQRG